MSRPGIVCSYVADSSTRLAWDLALFSLNPLMPFGRSIQLTHWPILPRISGCSNSRAVTCCPCGWINLAETLKSGSKCPTTHSGNWPQDMAPQRAVSHAQDWKLRGGSRRIRARRNLATLPRLNLGGMFGEEGRCVSWMASSVVFLRFAVTGRFPPPTSPPLSLPPALSGPLFCSNRWALRTPLFTFESGNFPSAAGSARGAA